MKHIIGFIAMLLPILSVAQSPPIKPLTIGDTVPDITITNVYNYPSSTIRLSDLKGKLVILDFWETYCSSCMEALLEFDSLQKKFGNKIQVITFARHGNINTIKGRLQRIKKLQNINLPIAVNDKEPYKYFPHELISHVIWISKEGIVKAITGSEYAKPQNIALLLNGTSIRWPVKEDVAHFNYMQPLLTISTDNLRVPLSLYYSSFLGNIDGIASTNRTNRDSSRNLISITYFNVTLLQLCHAVISGHCGTINPKNIVLDVADTSKYLFDESHSYYDSWAKENTYCYTVSLPISLSTERIRQFIKQDVARWLNTCFGLSVKYEQRNTDCWILKNTRSNTALLNSTSDTFGNTLSERSVSIRKLRKAPFENLLWVLNNETPNIPLVIDETNIPESLKVDMDLPSASLNNLRNLNKELKRYGLVLVPGQRKINMYVLQEGKQNQ